jgi:3-hydroxybutyryl-CoA dehydrogenase
MMDLDISRVAIIGLGTMGSQIATHVACFDYRVTGFDSDPEAFARAMSHAEALAERIRGRSVISPERWREGMRRVQVAQDLAAALAEADLVIETVPEVLALKREVWAEMDRLAPARAILGSSSSSMPVSRFEDVTNRPEKCVNLHFYQATPVANMVDVMGGGRTTPAVLERAVAWVRSIDCIPLTVNKEILGFCFNRVWRAIKRETLYLWAEGFVDFRDVDRAWMKMTGMSIGPFGIMDAVGLDVVYDIEMVYYEESRDPRDHPPARLKQMIESGELGLKTGKGFYDYPDPEFSQPEFMPV